MTTVNKPRALGSVNRLSPQQQRILAFAARPYGVSSHEAVMLIGGDRIQTRPHSFYYNGNPPSIVTTPVARSIAASVSRTISRLYRLGLIESRWHLPYRDAEQRVVHGQWRYHATARRDETSTPGRGLSAFVVDDLETARADTHRFFPPITNEN